MTASAPKRIIYAARMPAGFLLLATLFLSSCATVPHSPSIDLSQPGWTVRQAQAIWRPNRKAPELAGDLILATRSNSEAFIQFMKSPFTLVTAQTTPDHWHIEFPPENRVLNGKRPPPHQLIWLHLPEIILHEQLPPHWQLKESDSSTLRLENPRSGQHLEIFF